VIWRRRYMGHRRAYTPRYGPWMVLAVILTILASEALRTPAFASGVLGFLIGFVVANARWMIWRWRHPVISHDQYVEDLRRAARWN
jgi:hypothetical protein